ncbi:glycosyltransferase [Photobacterium carnosum]|uniref:glycosyltransferase family 2 protein n=1 Tax=Photobacterium carnosum TaxID=2023717 RepID=UPI001E558B20|nr:glycosyltransferase family 2 protein [Photobacterium carnosum]MCD9522774.1 glycosyltransferase [Photobacterium carnosum]
MKLVSIITPAFNCSNTILETYNSIKNQSYSNWEWLITDDCSSDNTIDIIKSIIVNDKRVHLFKHNINMGAAAARNNSIKQSSGDFIAFIDSDDLWHFDKLELQIIFMREDIDFSFTSYELIDDKGKRLNKYIDIKNGFSFNYNDMLKKKATLGCSTVILRKNAFSKIKMLPIKTGEDYSLWLDLLSQDKIAYKLDKVMMLYRIMPNSLSRNKFKTARRQWGIYRNIRDMSLLASFYVYLYYIFNAVFRK